MSAESFGAKLLSEIHEESLASLLSDLRAINEPQPKTVTGLPKLDAIIAAYRFSTGSAIVQRAGHIPMTSDSNLLSEIDHDEMLDDDFDPATSPIRPRLQPVKKPKPVVINLSSHSRDHSVATESVLYHLISLSVLPHSLQGQQNVAVYIDCSSKFSALQLQRCALSHARSFIDPASDNATSQTLSSTVKDALQHVHVIRCLSSKALLQTLKALPEHLLNIEAHNSSQRKLGLLIIDQINHFYWQDRFDAEIARLEGSHDTPNPASHVRSGQPESSSLPSQILTELKTIQNSFECAVIYTTTSTSGTTTTSQDTIPTPQPPRPPGPSTQPPNPNTTFDIYSRSALLVLQPTRKAIPQFSPHMTLEDCLHDRDKRNEALGRANYWFTASPGGLSDVRSALGSGVRGSEREMGFAVRVFGDGTIEIK